MNNMERTIEMARNGSVVTLETRQDAHERVDKTKKPQTKDTVFFTVPSGVIVSAADDISAAPAIRNIHSRKVSIK